MAISSCSITSQVKQDEQLLSSMFIRIKGNRKNIDRDEVTAIIKQKPNKSIAGVYKFHLRVHNFAKRGNERKWKKWLLENVAEEPVIYDINLADKSIDQIVLYLQKKGYYECKVEEKTVVKNKKLRQVYLINSGTPYLINNITYAIDDDEVKKIFFADSANTYLKKGNFFDQNKLDAERERITNLLKEKGYFFFSADYISYVADSNASRKTVDLKMQIKPFDQTLGNGNLKEGKHPVYKIKNIFIYPDFDLLNPNPDYIEESWPQRNYYFKIHKYNNFKKSLIDDNIFFNSGDLYSLSNAQLTYNRLNELKVFSSVKMDYLVNKDTSQNFLDAQIRLGKARQQSYALELQGTHSAGNYGIQGSISYQNKNVFKGAEIFRVKGILEIKQVPVPFESGIPNILTFGAFNTVEFGPEVSLTLPRLYPRFSTTKLTKGRTNLVANYNYQRNPNYFRTIFNTSFGYTIINKRSTISVFPIELNFVNVSLDPLFKQEIENTNNLVLFLRYRPVFFNNFRITYANSNQANTKGKNTYYIKLNGEIAGLIPTWINQLSGNKKVSLENGRDSAYTTYMGINFNNPYAQFGKLEFDYRYYFNYSDEQKLVLRYYNGLVYGFGNSSAVPFVKSFFAGGADDIRAWRPRTLGPGQYIGTGLDQIERIGDFKITLNAEYRFKVYKYLNLAFFVDAGNIWLLNTDKFTEKPGAQFRLDNFYRQLALGAGMGFRFDFSFFIIRLDIAAPIYDPNANLTIVPDNWIIKRLKITEDVNFFNLGIGYPF